MSQVNCHMPNLQIGIHALAVDKEERTGVEEYTYQVIRHMVMLPESQEHQFFLYVSPRYLSRGRSSLFSFLNMFGPHPGVPRVSARTLRSPIFWTQFRLSLEMLTHPVETLFIPSHILPLLHPQRSVVTIHGLEYEYYASHYPKKHRTYLRWMTRFSAVRASRIIVPSLSTKSDVVARYNIDPEKVSVVPHGASYGRAEKERIQSKRRKNPYLLFMGRIEMKKNIIGILEAYTILREGYGLTHELLLVGPPGFGYGVIKQAIRSSRFRNDIILTGYIPEREKQDILRQADIFVFPSWYEGFGLPILEAQALGVPVVTSSVSSMPEVAGRGAILVDPANVEELADAIFEILDRRNLRERLISLGEENVERFHWNECARKTFEVLTQPL